jgi:hypothetical protein
MEGLGVDDRTLLPEIMLEEMLQPPLLAQVVRADANREGQFPRTAFPGERELLV